VIDRPYSRHCADTDVNQSIKHLGHSVTTMKILLMVALTLFVTQIIIFVISQNASIVQYELFQAYCTSLFGIELWLLTNCNIDALCVAWRKTLHTIWNLPSCTHSQLSRLIFANVYHYLMRFVVDHLTLFTFVLFTIRL